MRPFLARAAILTVIDLALRTLMAHGWPAHAWLSPVVGIAGAVVWWRIAASYFARGRNRGLGS
jgi:hypothetical protein